MRTEVEASLLFLAMAAPETVALSGCIPEDFESGTKRAIWRGIMELATEGKKLITATGIAAKVAVDIAEIKQATMLPTLIEPEPAKAVEFGLQLRELAARDSLVRGLETLMMEPPPTSRELATAVMATIDQARVVTVETRQDAFTEAEDMILGGTGAIKTGWGLWDRIAGGVPHGFNMTLAARPGVGKTALMVALMDELSKRGVRVAYYTAEETRAAVLTRLIVRHCPTLSLREAVMGRPVDKIEEITIAMREVHSLPCTAISQPWRTIHELCFDIRRRHITEGLQVAFVDYIQILKDPAARRQGGRVAEVESISRTLRATAIETGVANVIGSQLKKQEGQPTLNDLKQSGAIEEDSATIMLMHRRDNGVGRQDVVPTILDCAKNRYGPPGEFALGFEKRRATFVEQYN